MSFWTGRPESFSQQSTLAPEQKPLYNQLVNAGLGQAAGGAFGQSADYYRGLLSDDSQDFNAFAAPEVRRFNEQTVPGLANQFGSQYGGLGGSSFRNALRQGSTDLSERLGAIRAQLRQQGAQGLANIGQQGLGQFTATNYQPQGTGLVDFIGPALGAAGTALGGPAAGVLGNAAGNWLSNKLKLYGQNGATNTAPGVQ